MKALKEKELRELAQCRVCEKKIGELPVPIIWKITAENHGVDLRAVSRQNGLAMMMGGNAALAQAMGPDEDMTVPMHEETCMICGQCLLERLPEIFQ